MTPKYNYEMYARVAIALGSGTTTQELEHPDHALSGYYAMTRDRVKPYINQFVALYVNNSANMDHLAGLIDERIAVINQIQQTLAHNGNIDELERRHGELENQISEILTPLDALFNQLGVPTEDWNR